MKNFFAPTTFNLTVVTSGLICCLFCILGVLLYPNEILNGLNFIRHHIFNNFSWFYISCCAFFLLFLAFLVLSRYGDIKLGTDEEEPEFSLKSWFSLLFTAGMGIGIIFLGVAEPLSHQISPIDEQNITQSALFHSIFHWSINAWAIYGLIALAIAYFGFRYKLPLSLRSCFYPLFKQKINSRIGDLIDILGLCTTLFGLITTLAYGAIRLAAAIESVSAFDQTKLVVQIVLLSIFTGAILLSMQRLSKGLRFISELNLSLTLMLLVFILATGPTVYLLSAFTENIGTYFSGLVSASFRTYIYNFAQFEWFRDWTVFYWAWWFAWAPAFGIFIARISRGRSIREFVLGVLIVPSFFFILWFTVFGNGAIWINEHLANGELTHWIDSSGKLLFSFLNYLPFSPLLQGLSLIIVMLFFLTTIDFGIYTLNNIASKDKSLVSPRWQAVMWGAVITLTTSLLFNIGGVEALQALMSMFSLPFAGLMILMAISLQKGLMNDYHYYHTEFAQTNTWTAENWRDRLDHLLNQHKQQEMLTFLKRTALPAMRELRQTLIGEYHLSVHLESDFANKKPFILLTIYTHTIRDFHYGIRTTVLDISQTLIQDENLPHLTEAKSYVSTTFFEDEQESYEVHHLTEQELIGDILQKYARFLTEIQKRSV
ncbi:choline/glycine/proline betaine transport protein [Nicoletella semolina]|uniref:Choline/glycine/proline betaine transport protein n=1 Tax=Nicoletella semolina TaxID=271160 RepID=A0A4V2SJS4_9PAST|nr:BCCT family transporter [Nicoletella semolina]MDH2924435.1 choline transporter [Nicoletella semolina]TCP16786.1 choline/glycine/proline betaine transport protein [Nicoletella semolina]